MKKIFAIIILFFVTTTTYAVVSNIHAVYKNGQVFVTWTNLSTTGVKYYLYKSVTPITNGTQLSFAQNLGYVVDSSGINKRLTKILSPTIPIGLRIDSAGNYLTVATGLFVATTTANGTFYYAIATKTGTVLDTSIVSGSNSLSVTDSVTETLADPQPVWQRSYTHDSVTAQFYVQFVTGITSATYPLMTNAGSFPFNFSIYKPNNLVSPLVVKLHAGDGNFIQSATNEMVTYENESRLSLDDWVPNDDVNTYWFGYHENYNIYSSSNPVHASGVVRAYTIRRVLHTIDWVTKHFNIDTSRIYLTGISMGAIGARTIAFLYPEKFAAVVMNVPKFNFYSLPELSLLTDMKNPSSGNYLTGYQARCIDYLLHEDLNLSHPFMIATNGKNDFVVGWSEKPVFYDSANVNLLGGAYYWDLKAHNGVGHNWKTNYSPNFFRFRNDCSYPAFSNCTSNGNPGNGSPADGDSVGTINGRIGWCDNITDLPSRYSIILKTMTLINQNLSGLFPALDSAVADVTLRRVQHFHPPDGTTIYWVNKKNGGQVIQHGCFVFNEGLMTVTAIRIFNESDTLIFSTATILSTDIQVSICNGSNYILPWGQMVSSAGIYSHVYSTAGSCDSLVRYFISIYPVYSIALNERVCQGSNYNLPWGGTATTAGIYSHT
ncbi:MAG: alpha/beta hydrolase-fold protein, partial [Bacteroidota bacterium]